jgi:hypothetical protein
MALLVMDRLLSLIFFVFLLILLHFLFSIVWFLFFFSFALFFSALLFPISPCGVVEGGSVLV